MALTAEEQRELDTLELEALEAEAAAVPQGSTGNVSVPQSERSILDNTYPVPTAFGTIPVNPVRLGQAVKNMGLEGGGATAGQILGAPFEAVGGIHIGGAVGGGIGNIAAQLTTPGKKFSLGEVAGAAGAGTIPGASLAKAGAKEVGKQALKYAGANVAATNAQSLIDTGKPASLSQDVLAATTGAASAPLSKFFDKGARAMATADEASRGSRARETLRLGRELGLVVPPAAVAPNAANNTIQSIAGKAAVAQEAILRNQPKINDAVRVEIGLPMNAPITPISLNTARVGPNLVYGEVANHSPASAGLLDKFKNSMDEARELRSAYRASVDAGVPNNATLAAARAAETQADVYKQGLKKVLPPDLFNSFDSARTQLAKIGLADRALNLGDGNISAKVFGDALDAGEKLTGNFAKLGRFENAFGRYVRDAASTPPSGVDYLKMFSKIGAGGGLGYAAGGVPGAIAGTGAMMAAEKGARELALSPTFQRAMVNPAYGARTADTASELARLGLMSAGRKELPSIDTPLNEEEMARLQELLAQREATNAP